MPLGSSDKDITLFAKTNFRNREVPFGIRTDDRRRHMYIIGKTGMGKTTFIENMVVQDIINGHGLCFVDPHGDSVEKVLNFIPANRVNDVIYLNPADVDFPIAFNPLEAVDSKYKHLVASGLMGVFTKIWAGVWSARMEYILNNTILALLDSPGNTMLGIVRMYVDKAYRKKIVDNIKDPVVKSFWTDEFANYQDKFRTEAVAPIQNKVGQFLSNAIIRNIVGQTKSSIDLRQIMDERKILLLNLSKGRIGEDSSALLGAMIITKLQLSAMSRVDMPEEDRPDFYLYVDEFQNFATESFANILSEARKYRLNLIVGHQYIGQLVQDKNTIVRDAIFGNVGTMIVFRVGADDAEFLEKEFEPTYLLNDLVNLSKYSIYLKLMINGVASNPFSASTLPPIGEPSGNTEKVIRVSRERYATPRETVEQKISKWLGAEYHTEAARAESQSVNEEGMEDEMRFKHPATPASRPAPASPRPASGSALPPRPYQSAVKPAPPAPRQASIPARPVAGTSSSPAPASRPVATPSRSAPVPAPANIQNTAPKTETVKPAPFVPPAVNIPAKDSGRPAREERRDNRPAPTERRLRQVEPNPGRRSTDKPARPAKHENPIWDTVSKMTSEKLQESVSRTNKALESLSKTLQESVVKTPLANKPQPVKTEAKPAAVPPSPAPKIETPKQVVPPSLPKPAPQPNPQPIKHEPIKIPQPANVKEIDLGHLAEPKLPEDHVHPEDAALSPHHNIQDTIARHGQLKPGDTVKFD